MASQQVNKKFVVVLVTGIVLLLGVMLVAYVTFLRKSGDDYARLGDQMMAEGNAKQAGINYGMAYGHDRSRVDWLEKWIGSLESWTPETRTEYSGAYRQKYIPVLQTLSQVKGGGTDIEAHDQYLGLMREQSLHSRYSREGADAMIAQSENAYRFFEYTPSDQTEWKRLLRYRGLAISRIISEGATLDEGMHEQSVEDLTAALSERPDDSESLRGLLSIRLRDAYDARVDDDFEAAQTLLDEARREVLAFTKTNPSSPDGLLAKLTVEVEQLRHDTMRENASTGQTGRITNTAQFKPQLDRIVSLVEQDPTAPGTARLAARFRVLEASLDPEAKLSRSERMARLLVEQDEKDASALMLLARILEAQGETDEQITVLRKIQDLESRPLSLEGMLQFSFQESALGDEAMAYLTNLSKIEDTPENEAARAEQLRQAEDARRRFAQIVPEGNGRLLMVDGMIALAHEDYPKALSLFRQFNELASYQDFDGLWREAQVAMLLRQNGVARDRLTQMRDMQPRNLPATLMLGRVEIYLNDLDGAKDLFEEALEIDPTNEVAIDGLREVRQLLGELEVEDPIVGALLESRRLLGGSAELVGDPRASINYLSGQIERLEYDPRIARELAGLHLGQNEMDEARNVIHKAVAKHPDDSDLKIVQQALLADNLIDARIRLYELSDAP